MFTNFMGFRFAYLAHINLGVIAGLLTSSVVFTSIFFWCLYKERIAFWTMIGMGLVCAGVVCVNIKTDQSDDEVDVKYLWLATFFAVTTGALISLNSVIFKHYVGVVHFTPV